VAGSTQKAAVVAEITDEVIMSDVKLPDRYHKPGVPASPIERVHTAVSEQSLLGRVVSGFVARLNTHAIQRNTNELKARREYTEEFERLTEATLKKDRALEHYLRHRDDLIRDDHERHLDQMDANRQARVQAKEEREHQALLAKERHQQELNQAKRATAQSQWGVDAFNQSRPHREERLEHLFRSGAMDAEIEALLLDEKISKLTHGKKTAEPAKPDRSGVIEQLLGMLDQEIDIAQKTHASEEVMIGYYSLRARLKSLLEQEKNRPE
jgi:hypothetical protein